MTERNTDLKVVKGFGQEWAAFDQVELPEDELEERFKGYFEVFPFDELPANSEGFDLGCGSGRWALRVAPRVGTLHCIDPAAEALDVAKRRLLGQPNVRFHLADADTIPLPDGSQDFGYSLGVLHHVPDTEAGMRSCVAKLKPGAPFLVYLYYNFDNRPSWFRAVWKVTEPVRQTVSRLPFAARKVISGLIATTIYWPMTRIALLAEKGGMDVTHLPLSPYRHYSFYTMRTDALDRFGTRLERRFSKQDIQSMMERCGLTNIRFHEGVHLYVACGRKQH
jgi:ubiquinone/menaquinone biosynthesis C-methylase UbiE